MSLNINDKNELMEDFFRAKREDFYENLREEHSKLKKEFENLKRENERLKDDRIASSYKSNIYNGVASEFNIGEDISSHKQYVIIPRGDGSPGEYIKDLEEKIKKLEQECYEVRKEYNATLDRDFELTKRLVKRIEELKSENEHFKQELEKMRKLND